MRPGVLGGLGWLLLVAALYASALDWLSARKLRDAWRGAEALSGELDESLACDLVTDFVHQNEWHRKVRCEPVLVVLGDVARLANVKVDWEYRTYCLARTPGWQVLRHAKGVPCFATPPPPGVSEGARVKEEAATRLAGRLEGIRRAMASQARPRQCVKRRPSPHAEVPLLEFELLQADGGSEAWAFLSTPWLRDAALGGHALTAIEQWDQGRPWVAVVTSATRREARAGLLIPGQGSWTRGALTGTLTLVDAEAGELLCEAPFRFESSASPPALPPSYGRALELAPVLEMAPQEWVQADFEARYQVAAMATLNEMTGYDAWPWMH